MVELVVDGRNALGECVLWCERSARLWWTDILGSTLWARDAATGAVHSWPMPERLGSFALTASDSRLLLGLATRLAWFDMASGAVETICSVEADLPSTRLNDGRCDRQGRFVFGTIDENEPRGAIAGFYRLGSDLVLERLPLARVAIANSICFSPDGATMYYCDSPTQQIRRCDYTGFGNDRVFAQIALGDPDGSCVDADGYLWNAQWGASQVQRFAPDGSVERSIALPVSQPSCVAFGGADLGTLFVTSARVGLGEREAHAGGVFSVAVSDVRGLPEARFLG